MQMQMTGHNLEITPALREYAEKKFSGLKPATDLITSMHITLHVDKLDQIAEAKIHVPGQEIYAKADSTESLYNAIDALVDKLSRQLVKYKEKNSDHRD